MPRLLAAHLSKQLSRPIIYVCPHIDDADNAVDDLQTFGTDDIQLLPAWEGEEEIADATDEIRVDRLKTVARISSLVTRVEGCAITIATSMQAICQPIPKLSAIESGSLALQTGKQTTPEDTSAWLIDNGFERTDKVDLPGQFARRGGIVDIYVPMLDSRFRGNDNAIGQSQAIRIEFFGDTIESIRTIDLDTQISTNQLSAVSIISATCGDKQGDRELFLNILPADAIVILHGIQLEVVKHTQAKRGFVLLPRRWVVERSFAWAARFRRLARDYERLAATLGAFHFLAFACLMIAQLFRFLA